MIEENFKYAAPEKCIKHPMALIFFALKLPKVKINYATGLVFKIGALCNSKSS
jgi:hypothetical protein